MADYLPLLTAAVAFALTFLLSVQYAKRRKLHQLEWLVALGLLGVAAGFAVLGNADVGGWGCTPAGKARPPPLRAPPRPRRHPVHGRGLQLPPRGAERLLRDHRDRVVRHVPRVRVERRARRAGALPRKGLTRPRFSEGPWRTNPSRSRSRRRTGRARSSGSSSGLM